MTAAIAVTTVTDSRHTHERLSMSVNTHTKREHTHRRLSSIVHLRIKDHQQTQRSSTYVMMAAIVCRNTHERLPTTVCIRDKDRRQAQRLSTYATKAANNRRHVQRPSTYETRTVVIGDNHFEHTQHGPSIYIQQLPSTIINIHNDYQYMQRGPPSVPCRGCGLLVPGVWVGSAEMVGWTSVN